MVGDTFDKKAYLAQMQTMNTLRQQMMDGRNKAIAELATHYTPKERAILADMFRKPMRP